MDASLFASWSSFRRGKSVATWTINWRASINHGTAESSVAITTRVSCLPAHPAIRYAQGVRGCGNPLRHSKTRSESSFVMLTISGLYKTFGRSKVLDGIAFKLAPAAITCLVGGNGSGKTTLFNLISGFLRPDAGSILLGDNDLTKLEPFRTSRLGVGRTFQDLRLIGKLTVQENILLAMPQHPSEQIWRAMLSTYFHREYEMTVRGVAAEILTKFFLTDVANSLASKISYGQQKLLTLACCYATNAKVLLLDEPVAGLSPEYRERIVDLLLGLKRMEKTILLIEHQSDFLEPIGDAFLFIESGQMREFETLVDLRKTIATSYFCI
jgi:ABC-type branched-subunit amino acid transport system ATPase component